MDSRVWRQDYEAIVRESAARNGPSLRPPAGERRRQPRFRLKSQQVSIKVEPRFQVVDISIAGIALHSDTPFAVGALLTMTWSKAFLMEATVVDCQLVLADPHFLETKYLVRMRFADEGVGMQSLVMMKQIDDLELAPDEPRRSRPHRSR